mmetsp:Transcript_118601/g.221637  ORF Transcript_118601/g.221637 Transcript_118601/m.221637 type:complete len:239 (-) Transcript_118601:204-920(-)
MRPISMADGFLPPFRSPRLMIACCISGLSSRSPFAAASSTPSSAMKLSTSIGPSNPAALVGVIFLALTAGGEKFNGDQAAALGMLTMPFFTSRTRPISTAEGFLLLPKPPRLSTSACKSGERSRRACAADSSTSPSAMNFSTSTLPSISAMVLRLTPWDCHLAPEGGDGIIAPQGKFWLVKVAKLALFLASRMRPRSTAEGFLLPLKVPLLMTSFCMSELSLPKAAAASSSTPASAIN